MTRWLITGAGGQLGAELRRVLANRDVVGLKRADLDIGDVAAVRDALAKIKPDVVINAAAYTAVDPAEADEAGATLGNVTGPRNLAAATSKTGARLVHVSTDYVFAGDADSPYDEDSPTDPQSVYGRTKRAGELAVLEQHPGAYVVRTAWVYGAEGANFVKTMVRLERERDVVSVVNDQRGSPTWSRDLAGGLVAIGGSAAEPGIYHCTNAGETTWFGLAQAIFEELGADPGRVSPTTTEAFPRPAPRPAYSVLGNRRWRAANLPAMPHWRDALRAAFATSAEAFRGSAS
jgi:dTDP-4-dehydrorhamnose reductase